MELEKRPFKKEAVKHTVTILTDCGLSNLGLYVDRLIALK